MDRAKIKIFGYIGNDTDLSMIQGQLAQAGGKPLSVEMSSIGGDVNEGTAIRNAIHDYATVNGADIEFTIMSWAESMASYITTIPGAKVRVHHNSLYMYHNPVTGVVGDYRKLKSKSAWIEKMTDFYAEAYSSRSGKDIEMVREEMNRDNELLGQEIVDAGFADEVIENTSVGMTGSKEEIVKMYREEHDRAMSMVGSIKDKNKSAAKPEKTNNKEVIMTEENKESKELALQVANERASACMTAMAALPAEYHKDIQDAFAKGESAGYFTGMVAHAKMVGSKTAAEEEKTKLEMAAKDSGEVPDLNLDDKAGQKPTVMAAAGSTGQKVKVG